MTLADLRAWLVAFLITQLVEIPIYLWFLRRTSRPTVERVAIAFAASAITHPLVWFAGPVVVGARASFFGFVAVVETFAIVTEAAWLAAFRVPRPIVASALANTVSVAIGLVALRLS